VWSFVHVFNPSLEVENEKSLIFYSDFGSELWNVRFSIYRYVSRLLHFWNDAKLYVFSIMKAAIWSWKRFYNYEINGFLSPQYDASSVFVCRRWLSSMEGTYEYLQIVSVPTNLQFFYYVFHSLLASTCFGFTCRIKLGLKYRIVELCICW